MVMYEGKKKKSVVGLLSYFVKIANVNALLCKLHVFGTQFNGMGGGGFQVMGNKHRYPPPHFWWRGGGGVGGFIGP